MENFTRLETPGDNAQNDNNDVHWTKVIVEPRSREVFSFQPQVVPANRVAVPAPLGRQVVPNTRSPASPRPGRM